MAAGGSLPVEHEAGAFQRDMSAGFLFPAVEIDGSQGWMSVTGTQMTTACNSRICDWLNSRTRGKRVDLSESVREPCGGGYARRHTDDALCAVYVSYGLPSLGQLLGITPLGLLGTP